MSDVTDELIEKWVEENTPPVSFEQEDESVGNKKADSFLFIAKSEFLIKNKPHYQQVNGKMKTFS